MLMGFKLLKQFKGLRGTALDVFGYTEERRMERALIQEYQASIDKVLAQLQAGHVSAERYALALELARLPESMKGFGHVKARNVDAARRKWADLEAKWLC
jgi:indolepyruvate ferredoxin oxidoreductase